MQLVWHTELRKVKILKNHKKNPRKISKEQLEKLKESITNFNYVEIVVVNTDNTILAGHMRIQALKALGRSSEEVEVRVPNRALSEREAEEYLIRSNKNSGEWDFDILQSEWDFPDLLQWGFTEAELQGVDTETVEQVDPHDDGYEEQQLVETKTKIGDIYELNDHKIICGSACDYNAVEKLLNSNLIDLVITDPPYNINYEGKTKEKLSIKNDNLPTLEFESLLKEFYNNANIFMRPGACIYVFHADINGEIFRKCFREASFKLSQCLIWEKDHFSLGRNDYHWKHEPILYGWKDGLAHLWMGDRTQTTVLKFKKPARNVEHPTMKPIELLGYLINNSSKKNDLIFDFFLGSGSTLIAADQTGRKCYGCELDPKYCDVIVDRFKKYKIMNNQKYTIKLNGQLCE